MKNKSSTHNKILAFGTTFLGKKYKKVEYIVKRGDFYKCQFKDCPYYHHYHAV